MEKTSLEKVKHGAVFAMDVYAIDGKLLVKKGTTFQEPFGQRFFEHGVKEVYVEKSEDLVEAPEDPLPQIAADLRKSLNIRDVVHEKTRMHAHRQMKKTLGGMSRVSNSNLFAIRQLVEEMIEELLKNKDLVLTLAQMRSADDYTYQHSVNVGVLSLLIGVDLGLDRETLRQLGIGAMLHDIGKTMVSEDIIKKPTKLTPAEYAEVKKHTDYGYEMLRHIDIPEEAALIALFHHEKFDGTGYSKGLKGPDIPYLARIVAVADVYDAMSHDRVYQRRIAHDKVYREITHLGNTHFDAKVMEAFIARLNLYPTGTGVVLNTGQRGIVLEQNSLYPESPKVRVFTPEKRKIKELYFDLDLSRDRSYHIVDTF